MKSYCFFMRIIFFPFFCCVNDSFQFKCGLFPALFLIYMCKQWFSGLGNLRTTLHVGRTANQRDPPPSGQHLLHTVRQKHCHWCTGHLWFWDLWDQQLRAVLHQLLQRKTATALHRVGAEARAGGIRTGRHSLDTGAIFQQSDHLRFGGTAASRNYRFDGWGLFECRKSHRSGSDLLIQTFDWSIGNEF